MSGYSGERSQDKLNNLRNPWYQLRNHRRLPRSLECPRYVDGTANSGVAASFEQYQIVVTSFGHVATPNVVFGEGSVTIMYTLPTQQPDAQEAQFGVSQVTIASYATVQPVSVSFEAEQVSINSI